MKEEVLVGLDHFFYVIVADGNFAGSIFLTQAPLQHLRRGLEIDHQIRDRQLLAEMMEVAVVNLKLRVAEIDVREQFVFLEDVVSHHGFT